MALALRAACGVQIGNPADLVRGSVVRAQARSYKAAFVGARLRANNGPARGAEKDTDVNIRTEIHQTETDSGSRRARPE